MGGLCPKEDQQTPEPSKESQQQQQRPEDDKKTAQLSNIPADAKKEPEEKKQEVEEKIPDSSKVVIRREIRSLSGSEVSRFFDAIDKMLENKSGPGTSEFYRCASYHGEPPPIYCHHGRETFPGWHRIYLLDFEKALQTADKANGNDGNVSLPYWDWSSNQSDGLPKVIRDRFKGWPKDFWPDSLKGNSRTQRLIRGSDRSITSTLRSWGIAQQATDCLLATEHWAHASTRFSGTYPSIESPHNSVHTIAGGSGGQMGSVAWAAYDIVFWLHHCNVDRIYEAYLKIEPDSAAEFENFQDTQNVDMFETDFEPFFKEDGSRFTAKDTFNVLDLGYKYDKLDGAPPQQLREPPTLLLFSQVKVYEFESKCYQIHAWIVEKGKEDEFKVPSRLDDIDYESVNYVGGAGIFGRGMECANCVNRPPQDIMIDITRGIRKLGVNRYSVNAVIRVLETTDDDNTLFALSETPLPEPIITGPLFANVLGDELLDEDDKKSNNEDEVRALQRFLHKFGYYDKDIDGDYGAFTSQAVTDYQIATGDLKVDGIAGPKTRTAIINNKRCDNIDPFAKNEVECKESLFNYKSKDIKYYIGVGPGYLSRNEMESVISRACNEYTSHFDALSLTKCDDEKEAQIVFSFIMFNRENDPLRFDGSGGVLGKGGTGYVHFDLAERWSLKDDNLSDLFDQKTWYRSKPIISLYYTALHELGHSLGLAHSVDPNDVMSPWYNPKQIALSKNDIQNLEKIINN